MNEEKKRPYLSARRCGRCIVPLTTEERREDGWLFVTYRCPSCDFKQIVTFSPAELMEWERRGARARAAANSMI